MYCAVAWCAVTVAHYCVCAHHTLCLVGGNAASPNPDFAAGALVGSNVHLERPLSPPLPPEVVFAGRASHVALASAIGKSHTCVLPTAMGYATLGAASLTSRFSVTEEAVNELFFSHRNSRDGTLPARSCDGQFDEEGWLWRAVLGQDTPPMPTTLADAFNARLDSDDSPVLLAVAPPGSGKSFGAWQLGTSRYVDLLDAVPTSCHRMMSGKRRS